MLYTLLLSYLLPQSLLTGESQRQIDSIERHPVDLSLPSGPVPPHRGIADGAHVLVVTKPGHKYTDVVITDEMIGLYANEQILPRNTQI